jgi:hypothetical protein
MKFNRGDLIAIKTLDNKRITAIIVSEFNGKFLYCYCIDSGIYRLVYDREVEFTIKEEFAPDFVKGLDYFDIDYSFYDACTNTFTYTPFFGLPVDFSDEDD